MKEKIIQLGGKLWEKNGLSRVYISCDILNKLEEESGKMLSNFGERNNKLFYDEEKNAVMRSYKSKAPQIELKF